jgi:hypothetical protein
MMYRLLAGISILTLSITVHAADSWDEVQNGYADSNGMEIHYATLGEGPTIVSVPNAGHFVQQDAAELVSSTLKWRLLVREPKLSR